MKISFKDNCDYLWQSLGISEDRKDELQYRMSCIIHEVTRPVKKGEEGPGSDKLIKLFIALAENEQEFEYVSYCSAEIIPKIYDTSEEDEDMFVEWDENDDDL